MRPGGPGKRARNNRNHQQRRGSGGGGGGNRNQSFDSNGPEVKVRGSAAQVAEKYVGLARDATSAGDRVAAENYLQHAEHYTRIVNANNERAAELAEAARERAERERPDDVVEKEAEVATAEPEVTATPAPGRRKKAAAVDDDADADGNDDSERSQPAA
jgi:Domain of unknown function (DUF4167)